MEKQKPDYTRFSGRYGDLEYSYLEDFCQWCGFEILYDGLKDDVNETVIHMGLDKDYKNRNVAEFDLAHKLAERIYRKMSVNPNYFSNYDLPLLKQTDPTSEEMIINTWADFFVSHAYECESYAWTRQQENEL